MAGRAGQRGMRASQCVAGNGQVVKLRIEPGVDGVAGLAGGWKSPTDVIDNWREKVLLVAGVAGSGESCELTNGSILVAIFALQHGMRPNQREAVLVVADLLQRDLPAPHRVAALAVGSETDGDEYPRGNRYNAYSHF